QLAAGDARGDHEGPGGHACAGRFDREGGEIDRRHVVAEPDPLTESLRRARRRLLHPRSAVETPDGHVADRMRDLRKLAAQCIAALEQNDVELDVEALERTAHPGRPAADHDDIVLLVGHGRPTRARRSDSSLTERSDPWTAATHRRATN